MPCVERKLVRGKSNLSTAIHNLQLDGNKLTRLLQRDKTIRDTQIYSRLNSGNKATWEVVPESVIQARLGLHWHP